ncbi:MAG: DUF1349 domain-containing protein [Methylacidiphilales bacterium]|nr:DUF1349 domain-containing protein [Candidatus Methylacidiphilales bacterium]
MKHFVLICSIFLGYAASPLRAGSVVTITDGNEVTGTLSLSASSIHVEGGLSPTEINLSDILEANFGETPFQLDFFFSNNAKGNQLPATWKEQTMGEDNPPGAVVAADGTFTLSGNEALPPPSKPVPGAVPVPAAPKRGISDNLFFVGQPWTGDGQWTARVKEIDAKDPQAVAGLMMRDTLDADSGMCRLGAMSLETGEFLFRGEVGKSLQGPRIPIMDIPVWLRLTRYGTRVVAAISSDGKEWDPVAQNSFQTPVGSWIGLYVDSREGKELGKAVFDQVSFTPAPSSAQVLPPGVLLQSGSFLAGYFQSLNFDPATSDADGKFNRNGTLMTIPRANIAAVTLLPTAWSQIADMASHVGLLMKNGDIMDGTPEAIDAKGVSVSSLLLGLTTYDQSEVRVCILHPVQAQSGNYEIRLRDGSRLNATSLNVSNKEVDIEEASGLHVTVSLDEIAQFRAGPSQVQSLAELDWKATPPPAVASAKAVPVANTPQVANAVSDAPPPVQCWEGPNQEQIMEAPVGTSLEFPLPGKFHALGMRIALSPDSPPNSQVNIRVLADGREIARTPPFKAGEEPRFMEVTIQNPKTVTLQADSIFAGSKVLFIDPVAIRDN